MLLITAVILLVMGCAEDSEKKAQDTKKEDNRETAISGETAEQPEILDFVDVYGKEYQVEINPDIEKHTYDMEKFEYDGDRLSYTDEDMYNYRLGVDVSKHQGTVDWEKVKEKGYEVAIIRVGYRGYGEEGLVCLDEKFHENIQARRQQDWMWASTFLLRRSMRKRPGKKQRLCWRI